MKLAIRSICLPLFPFISSTLAYHGCNFAFFSEFLFFIYGFGGCIHTLVLVICQSECFGFFCFLKFLSHQGRLSPSLRQIGKALLNGKQAGALISGLIIREVAARRKHSPVFVLQPILLPDSKQVDVCQPSKKVSSLINSSAALRRDRRHLEQSAIRLEARQGLSLSLCIFFLTLTGGWSF